MISDFGQPRSNICFHDIKEKRVVSPRIRVFSKKAALQSRAKEAPVDFRRRVSVSCETEAHMRAWQELVLFTEV